MGCVKHDRELQVCKCVFVFVGGDCEGKYVRTFSSCGLSENDINRPS